MHDTALLNRWHESRDAEAFRALTVKYGRMVYAATLRVLGNEADAEDVTQECFEKLASTRRAPGRYFGPWLHRMAVNKAIDRLRSDSRRRNRNAKYQSAQRASVEPTWDDIYPLVDEAINDLPEKWRRAVVAHYLEGRTQDNIADAEGLSRSAINYRIKRGVERIRRSLDKKGVAATIALLTSLLGTNAAKAAPISQSLTEKLGRLALSGTHVRVASNVVSFFTIQKLAVTSAALIAVVVAGVAYQQYKSGKNPDSNADSINVTSAVKEAVIDSDETAIPAVPSERFAASPTEPMAGNNAYIEGRVIDRETGDGIPEARVVIGALSTRWDTSIYTDDTGIFRTGILEPDQYQLACLEANGYLIPFLDGDNLDPASIVRADLRAGEPRTGIEIALGRGQTARGRVRDMSGRPVSGANVTARMEKENTPRVNTALSAQDGTFEVSGFPETVMLYAWAEADGLVSKTYGPLGLPQLSEAATLVLSPASIIRGTVVDDAGNPMPGLRIVPQFAQPNGGREIETTTDAKGRYELTGMFPGRSSLRVCRDNKILNNPIPSITIGAGEIIEDLTLVCSSPSDESIAGVVMSKTGTPLAGATVWCAGKRTRTDERGRFQIAGLNASAYRLSVSAAGHMHADVHNIVAGSTDVRIELSEQIRLDGRVLHAETREPLTEFEVKSCYPSHTMLDDRDYASTVSFNGSFSLDIKQGGRIRIAARAPGFLIGYEDILIKASDGDITDVDILMRPAGPIHGTVRDQHGDPIGGVQVRTDEGHYRRSREPEDRTDENGQFNIAATKLGDPWLLFFHPDFPKSFAQLEEEHIQGAPLSVVLFKGTEVAITALIDGQPFPNATLYFPEIDETIHADAAGKAIAKTIPPGVQKIAVTYNSADGQGNHYWITHNENINIAPGTRTAVRIDATHGSASISGSLAGFVGQTSLNLRIQTAEGERSYHHLYESVVPTSYLFDRILAGTGHLQFGYTLPDRQVGTANFDIKIADGEHLVLDLTPETLAGRSQ